MDDSSLSSAEAARRWQENIDEVFRNINIIPRDVDSVIVFQETITSSVQSPPSYEEFRSVIGEGKVALDYGFSPKVCSAPCLDEKLVAVRPLQSDRFPQKVIRLLVTDYCVRLNNTIDKLLKQVKKVEGLKGPSGMGKSYAFLYSYMLLRQSKDSVIIYINNPERLFYEETYMAKELIFAFARQLAVPDIDFGKFPLNNMDRKAARLYFERQICDLRDDDDLLMLLWAFYMVGYDGEMLISICEKVLLLLTKYCAKLNLKYFLLLDQYNVFFREGLDKPKIRELWNNLLVDGKIQFEKVIWVASLNNESTDIDSPIPDILNYYQDNELMAVIGMHIARMAAESMREIWTKKIQDIFAFVKEYTNSVPLEVDRLLTSTGFTIQDKCKEYILLRKGQLLKSFKDFRLQKSFKPSLCYAIFPMVNAVEDFGEYFDTHNIEEAFNYKNKLLAGCVDRNLIYVDEKKMTFRSLTPIAEIAIRDIMFRKRSSKVLKIIKAALGDRYLRDAGMCGKLFEYFVIMSFTENWKTCDFQLSLRQLDGNNLIRQEPKEVTFSLNRPASFEFDEDLGLLLKSALASHKELLTKGSLNIYPEGTILIPISSFFPCIDFLIIFPDGKTNECGGKANVVYAFQVTTNIKTHGKSDHAYKEYLKKKARNAEKMEKKKAMDKNKREMSVEDLKRKEEEFKEEKLTKFESFCKVLEYNLGTDLEFQFIWVTKNIDLNVGNLRLDKGSWIMSDGFLRNFQSITHWK